MREKVGLQEKLTREGESVLQDLTTGVITAETACMDSGVPEEYLSEQEYL